MRESQYETKKKKRELKKEKRIPVGDLGAEIGFHFSVSLLITISGNFLESYRLYVRELTGYPAFHIRYLTGYLIDLSAIKKSKCQFT